MLHVVKGRVAKPDFVIKPHFIYSHLSTRTIQVKQKDGGFINGESRR